MRMCSSDFASHVCLLHVVCSVSPGEITVQGFYKAEGVHETVRTRKQESG